jgi:hypothetical protein
MRPYMILNKEIKDFKGYSTELEVLYITKYFHLVLGIDCECYKKKYKYKFSIRHRSNIVRRVYI